jgi:hypothetical protein
MPRMLGRLRVDGENCAAKSVSHQVPDDGTADAAFPFCGPNDGHAFGIKNHVEGILFIAQYVMGGTAADVCHCCSSLSYFLGA